MLKLMSIELVMPSSHLILCHPLIPPGFNLSQHQDLFQWVRSSYQVTKVLELQLQHQSFQWISSVVQFSHSVMSDSLWLHGMQHTRPPYLSPTPAAYSSSCLLSQWCHPTISFSVIPFSSRLQSFPASGYFQMSQFFASGGQSIRVSASASVLPMNIQDWFLILCESFVCNTNYRNKQWFKIILFLFLVCFILLINHLEPFPLNPTDLM